MHNDRLKKIKKILVKEKADALFVSNPYSIYYLTGFKTLSPQEREAFVLVTKTKTYLFTDLRHDISFNDDSIEVRLITPQKNMTKNLQEIVKEEKIKTLGFEMEDLKFSEFNHFSNKLKVKLEGFKNVVTKLREIKEEGEVKSIKEACRLADECLKQIVRRLKVGITEKEVAFRIEYYLKQKGFDISFQPIVAYDRNSAIPHYDTQVGSGILKKDSVVLIDFGATFQSYCSDMTRMFFMKEVSNEVINVYKKLLKAQEETIKKIKDFKKTKEIDEYVRKLLKKEGFPNFPHSTGHGVGLEVHELPRVSQKSKDVIHDGQVFTIEPGVYFAGKYGLRIEDIVWVNKGVLTTLTGSPKAPQVLAL